MRVPPDTWFTQEVLADGNHLVIKVNGTTTVDYRDPNDTYGGRPGARGPATNRYERQKTCSAT
jgi:Domain of Unknown Function (DUF1080)